jgi:tripartite-type tricarboxylate transporter receptor subunit TctC
MKPNPRIALVAACTCALTLAAEVTRAQQPAYPAKPIRIIVPFAPGGATDILARAIGQKMTEGLGQPVIVDNRPGAGGNIGSDVVAKAQPDGYTLLMGGVGPNAINATLYPKLPYDAANDFAPVAHVANVTNLLVVHPSVPAKSVKELIAIAKARPGKLTHASSSPGSAGHLAGEMMKIMAGIDMVTVNYKGSAPALVDLISGQVDLMFDNMPPSLPHIKSGKLKALAVSGGERTSVFPDLPTIAESGLPGFDAGSWFGILAPAGTPPAIVNRLNAVIMKSLTSPELRERLSSQGAAPVGGTPEQFGRHIRAEIAKWAKVIKAANVKLD